MVEKELNAVFQSQSTDHDQQFPETLKMSGSSSEKFQSFITYFLHILEINIGNFIRLLTIYVSIYTVTFSLCNVTACVVTE